MLFSPPGFEHYDYTTLVPKLASQVPSIKHFVMLNDIHAKYRFVSSPLKSVGYEQYLSQSGSLLDLSPFEMKGQHDIVNVQFTSGSTGLPKAVALSHYNSKQLALEASLDEAQHMCNVVLSRSTLHSRDRADHVVHRL